MFVYYTTKVQYLKFPVNDECFTSLNQEEIGLTISGLQCWDEFEKILSPGQNANTKESTLYYIK